MDTIQISTEGPSFFPVLTGNLTRMYPCSEIIPHKVILCPNVKNHPIVSIITKVSRVKHKCQRSGTILKKALKIRAGYF